MFDEKDVGEGGCGPGVSCAFWEGQEATVGLFGGGQVGGCFGDLGGEENVVGLLRSELECGKEFVGCCGEVGRGRLLIEPGEGSEGARFEDGVRIRERGGGEEFGAGLRGAVAASQEKTEGDVGRREERIGVDGLAVAGLGGGDRLVLVGGRGGGGGGVLGWGGGGGGRGGGGGGGGFWGGGGPGGAGGGGRPPAAA